MTNRSEPQTTTVYKAVLTSPRRGIYLSYMAAQLPENWIAEYRVGAWTEPPVKGSKLFAFTNKCIAFHWATDIDIAVFRAEATGVRPIRTAAHFFESSTDLQKYWQHECCQQLASLPSFSVACDRIRLVNMIKE